MSEIRTDLFPNQAMAGDVEDYIVRGVPQGSFLAAVLSNDLRAACAQADCINQPIIFEIVCWLWNHAPTWCWGSSLAYTTWCQRGGLEGMHRAAAAEAEPV